MLLSVLYGHYYTVISATHPSSLLGERVHGVVCIDITRVEVLAVEITPIRFINIAVNSLTHVLYGQGLKVVDAPKFGVLPDPTASSGSGLYPTDTANEEPAFWRICEAVNVSELGPDWTIEESAIPVECNSTTTLRELENFVLHSETKEQPTKVSFYRRFKTAEA